MFCNVLAHTPAAHTPVCIYIFLHHLYKWLVMMWEAQMPGRDAQGDPVQLEEVHDHLSSNDQMDQLMMDMGGTRYAPYHSETQTTHIAIILNQSINQSMNQSINQSIKQASKQANQSNQIKSNQSNQSIKQLINQ